MIKTIKKFFAGSRGGEQKATSDFSDFFDKKSGYKVKVIRQILREANAEQREVVRKYHERLGIN